MTTRKPSMIETLKAADLTNADIISLAALARLPNAYHETIDSMAGGLLATERCIVQYKEANAAFRQFGDNSYLQTMNNFSRAFQQQVAPWFAKRGPKLREFMEWARI